MDTVHELQRKINDYEVKRIHYEREIRRLKDDLLKRDKEIIRAKFTILHALPQLKDPPINPSIDIVRTPGYLDPEMFKKACLERCLKNSRDDRDRAILEAEILYDQWRDNTSNGVWQPYIVGPDQVGDQIEVELHDLVDLRDTYGEELYNAVKIAWFEAELGRMTGVHLKPWNYVARREKTLTELLSRIYLAR